METSEKVIRRQEVIKARQAITDIHGTAVPKESIQGEIRCPVCSQGQLIYRISSHNGHIHAQCDSGNCVYWME